MRAPTDARTSRRWLGVLTLAALMLGVATMTGLPSRSRASATTIACSNAYQLSTWTTAQLINETIVVPYSALDLGAAVSAARDGYGGIILFGNTGPSNLRAMLATLRADEPRRNGLLVMTDDEGGGVWRLRNLISPLPWARQMAALTPARITSLATTAGRAMASLGINMDLAPVLDLDGRNVEPGNANADGYRSFGASASLVTTDARAFYRGLLAAHVVPVVKHFPGLGGVSPNTDVGPAATAPWPSVEAHSLSPFVAAIDDGVPALMVSNATIPGLTTLPASLSRAVMTVLRHQLHFKGLIMTDSLSAGSISAAHFGVVGAAVAALGAGADVVLFSVPANGNSLALAQSISRNVEVAVSQHKITRAQLLAAATLVVISQGVSLCH